MFKSEAMLHLGVVAETEPVDGSKHSNIVQVRMAALEPQMAQDSFLSSTKKDVQIGGLI